MKYKNGFFIIGTDTDIGKTYVSSLLYKSIRELNGFYFKPIQSGCYKKENNIIAPDVDFICTFNNIDYNSEMVGCTLIAEVSPHLAAELENKKIDLSEIENKISILKNKYTYLLFEGAGGLHVPIIRNNFFIYDLIKMIDVPVIIVSSTKVGSINHAILTFNALKSMNIKIHGFVFNNYTGNFYENDNIKNILDISGCKNYLVINKNQTEIKREEFLNFFGGYFHE